MARLILSGAGGFLGSAIMQNAMELNIKIVAITSRPQEIKSIYGDSCDTLETKKFLNGSCEFCGTDVFINCLFPTNADGYRMADGLEKVFQMMKSVEKSGGGAFINISSQSVYASQRIQPAVEGDPLCLETPYAVAKYSSESFCDYVFQQRRHTNIRLASLLGVGYDQRLVNRMVAQALNGNELKVVGGMQRYGFLDVRDAAAGIMKVAMSDSDNWRPVYNLGRMESYTLIDIVQTIVSEMEKRGLSAKYTVKEGVDTRNSSLNVERFMMDFLWKPVVPLTQTIGDIIDKMMEKNL